MKQFQRATEASAPVRGQADKNVQFSWGVQIPMRDGVHLNATIYQPRAGEPVPAVFTLTPYISDSYHPRAYYFAQHGYAFALVDCRGRGNSEGKFVPFVNESADAHDVVEWLAAQPWCSGAVSMWGGSYGGFDQWMALKANPQHLKTIAPVASCYIAVDFPFFKNIFIAYEIQWLTLTSGLTGNANLFGESAFWIEKFRQLYLEHRPFKELDQIVGNPSTVFQEWMRHPTLDDYYQPMALTSQDYDRIQIPILTITGHYDGDQSGALTYYTDHMASASPAKDRHFLVIGPWDHPGTRTPQKEFGGLKFGEASLVDMNQLHTQWYDWMLKNGAQPEFLKKRVACYLAGAEEWRYADQLEDLSNQTLRLYMNSSAGQANDAFHSGFLQASPPAAAQPDSYVYDPLDTRPAELEKDEITNYYTDQRYELNLFGNGLIYHSAPLETDTDVTGWPRLSLWLTLDVPDCDFLVSLYEILPDGGHILLSNDVCRARYRESLQVEKLVAAGEILRYDFSGFTFFSRRLAKGSRLRLFLASPNSIFWQKNYNGGGVVADESAKDARTAHVTLYHDAEHPSCLELKVNQPQA